LSAKEEKRVAALEAITYIKDGMTVGLGTGSTAYFMIIGLGEKVAKGLKIKAVATSIETENLAKKVGIPVITLAKAARIDITIDGADEVDGKMQLIKGGGGALLREKIVAHNSNFNIIIADSSKKVHKLGRFKLPIETIPFSTALILNELAGMGLKPNQRMSGNQQYKTDENNDIIDIDIWDVKDSLNSLEEQLKQIPGIVETGLFLNSTDMVIVGNGSKVVIDKK